MNYQDLINDHADLFENTNSLIKVITDFDKIREWQIKRRSELLNASKPSEWADIGIVLNDPFIVVIRDLVEFPGGYVGGYFRVINRADLNGGQGVVVLGEMDGKLLLLNQFRHPVRSWSFEVPRGFGQSGTPAEEQAKNELLEEVGGEIDELVDLGIYYSNTGLEGNKVKLFYAKLKSVGQPAQEEGIESFLWVSLAELEEMIASAKITDGFTIAAYTRAKLRGLLG
ncbi:MAG: NUDIX hydrolase [Anaerolineaceae bacterium]|nr:MAG: NUDIX hydrolase [Anaerolineaceae bacterium]